jgi:hypothetical protein
MEARQEAEREYLGGNPHVEVAKETSHFCGIDDVSQAKLTTRLVLLLLQYPDGLNKRQIIAKLYPESRGCSERRLQSLNECVGKIIQRARNKHAMSGIDIKFVQAQKIWTARFREPLSY